MTTSYFRYRNTGKTGRHGQRARRRFYRQEEALRRQQRPARQKTVDTARRQALRAARKAEAIAAKAESAKRALADWGTSTRHLPRVYSFSLPEGANVPTTQQAIFQGMQNVFFGMLADGHTLEVAADRAMAAFKGAINSVLNTAYNKALQAWQQRGPQAAGLPLPAMPTTWAGRPVDGWKTWARKLLAHLLACTVDHTGYHPLLEDVSMHSSTHGLLIIQGNGGFAVRLINRANEVAEIVLAAANDNPLPTLQPIEASLAA